MVCFSVRLLLGVWWSLCVIPSTRFPFSADRPLGSLGCVILSSGCFTPWAVCLCVYARLCVHFQIIVSMRACACACVLVISSIFGRLLYTVTPLGVFTPLAVCLCVHACTWARVHAWCVWTRGHNYFSFIFNINNIFFEPQAAPKLACCWWRCPRKSFYMHTNFELFNANKTP